MSNKRSLLRLIAIPASLIFAFGIASTEAADVSGAASEIATLCSIFTGFALSLLVLPETVVGKLAKASDNDRTHWQTFLKLNLSCLVFVFLAQVFKWPYLKSFEVAPFGFVFNTPQFSIGEFLVALVIWWILQVAILDLTTMLKNRRTISTVPNGNGDNKVSREGTSKTTNVDYFPTTLTKDHAKLVERKKK